MDESAGHFCTHVPHCYTGFMTHTPTRRKLPLGVLIGAAVGIALGIALDNLALGVSIGAGLAVLFGLALDRTGHDDS